jgi:hypothetical protein
MQPLADIEAGEIDITVTTEEVQVQPDETFPLSVEVANRTQFILSGFLPNPVSISYHSLSANLRTIIIHDDGHRTPTGGWISRHWKSPGIS